MYFNNKRNYLTNLFRVSLADIKYICFQLFSYGKLTGTSAVIFNNMTFSYGKVTGTSAVIFSNMTFSYGKLTGTSAVIFNNMPFFRVKLQERVQ